MGKTNTQIRKTCTIDLYAPSWREIRSTSFNADLASYYDQLGVPASAIIDFVFRELLECHQAALYDFNSKTIDLSAEDKNGDMLLDRCWGDDPERFINRYLERARRPHRNRLKHSVLSPVLMLHFARRSFAMRSGQTSFVILA